MAKWEQSIERALSRVVEVRPQEVRAMLWAFAYFFCLLTSYYVLRPVRDEMGVAGGVRNMPWLFSATLITMLIAVPIYGALVARLPRARFIPLVYHFFALNLVLFWVFLSFRIFPGEAARAFFVWISIFNLFVVSIFWSFLADLFRTDQAKRLFGFVAAGGTAGALLGPTLTVSLAGLLGPANLLLVAMVFLEIAVFCAMRLERTAERVEPVEAEKAPKAIGGNPFAGFSLIVRSPYLAGIALWVVLLSLAGTFLYFAQAELVTAASGDPATRTRIFATIDLVSGILTLIVQFLATGRLIQRFGTGPATAFLPIIFAIGFAILAAQPLLAVAMAFQALQRTANFSISNPAREMLFTAVDREEKYKAKNIIDGALFRGADALWAWAFTALRGVGLDVTGIALLTIPIALGWLVLALGLGRAQEKRSAQQANELRGEKT
ncbi:MULTISPECIES: Npt1/Npt2 family nucleotide transporter [unclassified Beijerinckia]|uniref:NTP/NDP exchange transporter n=1 Tax=unclassified Beijerinckia TaxID=2638183 RepID=UPI00089C9441|nr:MULTISPECIES: Npt1/Npt2 family nucleotide transporter [unclassified Beijerinckia]MDH7798778.1 AAA family ATP:ADP antiporter [Beijerinckia sp. GAS462]SED32877.1 ATP:ADP antiporter, AAA family [Beijerinckia sp. 28-YEA-48]